MAEAPDVTFTPTEEQHLIRTTARQFLNERLGLGRVRELMVSEDGFDPGLWKEMADLGWAGLAVAEEHGGSGLSPVELGVLVEEMGRLVTPGPFFATTVLAATVIQAVATPDQQAEILPSLASGERVATLAIHERSRDWGPESPETTATRSEDCWVLNGSKRSVLSGNEADIILVTASTGEGVGLFAVDSDAEGVETKREPVLDPTRRQAGVLFDSVVVEAASKLGEGDATAGLRRALALVSALLACEQVGGAQRCMEMSVEYAKGRYQFGRPIGSYQAIKHRCANMLMKVEQAKSAAYYAVRVASQPEELMLASALAAAVASEAYVWVAGENIQVHGGIGFTWEHDAHIYLKRAKASSLLFGSPSYQRDQLGQALGL